ncbi:unnamed protein product [Effrenium voratum]|uniref:Uncharacterized protein n=1 Tax=Effrenium voratum TaxID=2562239 RepID=A0AA36IFA0_9DINO|nr:unnamed protein product [Effrenium voratum]
MPLRQFDEIVAQSQAARAPDRRGEAEAEIVKEAPQEAVPRKDPDPLGSSTLLC